MIEFSSSLATRGLPTLVSSENDVSSLITAFTAVVKSLKLYEYYVFDVAREKESIKTAIASTKVTPWTGPAVAGKTVVELAEILRSSDKIAGYGKFASRFGLNVDPAVAAGFVSSAFIDLTTPDELSAAWVRIVDVINVPLYQEWEEDTKVAIDNIANRLRYTRLELHQGEITKTQVFVCTHCLCSDLILTL